MPGRYGLILIGGEWNLRTGIAHEFSRAGWRVAPVDSYDEVDAGLIGTGIVACKVESGDDIPRLTQRMAQDGIWLPIVACIPAGGDHALINAAFQAGAQAITGWPFAVADMERLLADAEPGMLRHVNRLNAQSMARARLAALTPRERDVLEQMILHGSSKSIAARLDLSPRTVEIYRGRILQRLGATHIAQAIWVAFQSGEIGPDIITQIFPGTGVEAAKATLTETGNTDIRKRRYIGG